MPIPILNKVTSHCTLQNSLSAPRNPPKMTPPKREDFTKDDSSNEGSSHTNAKVLQTGSHKQFGIDGHQRLQREDDHRQFSRKQQLAKVNFLDSKFRGPFVSQYPFAGPLLILLESIL